MALTAKESIIYNDDKYIGFVFFNGGNNLTFTPLRGPLFIFELTEEENRMSLGLLINSFILNSPVFITRYNQSVVKYINGVIELRESENQFLFKLFI